MLHSFTRRTRALAYLLIVIALLVPFQPQSIARAESSPPPALFQPLPGRQPAAGADAFGALALQQRAARLDTTVAAALLSAGEAGISVRLPLFDDAVFDAALMPAAPLVDGRAAPLADGRAALAGTLADVPGSSVTLALNGSTLSGEVVAPGLHIQLRTGPDGLLVIRRLDPLAAPEDLHLQPPAGLEPDAPAGALAATDDDGSRIDVLVVYTDLAASGEGGEAAMRSLIDLAIAESNTAFANSRVPTRYHLAAAARVSFAEPASLNWGDTLTRLTNAGDGVLDEVHALRNAYAADLVVLLVNSSTPYAGIAWLMTDPSAWFEANAFAVVSRAYATGNYSFAHETGHLMGSHHDRATANGSAGAYPYSYGYWAPNNAFRTIMAYNCPAGCQRINYFSNPDVVYNGQPTGRPAGAADAANNALSITNNLAIVASFRDGPAPVAPTNLQATSPARGQAALTWKPGSTNEDGFAVERALLGSSDWQQVAVTARGASAYTAGGLSCDLRYQFRVRAISGDGNSPYSNTAAPNPSACAPAAPAALTAQATAHNVALAWTDASDNETGFRVQRSEAGGAWLALAELPANTTVFADATARCESRYAYRVLAYNAAGEVFGPASGEVTTPACLTPPAPGGLSAAPYGIASLRLSWSPPGYAEGYHVERLDPGASEWREVGIVSATAFIDSGLTAPGAYSYRISAANRAGESGYSAAIQAEALLLPVYLPGVMR